MQLLWYLSDSIYTYYNVHALVSLLYIYAWISV